MANLTKDQVRTILQNAPKGSNPGRIIEALAEQGNILEGYNDQAQKAEQQKIQEEGQLAQSFLNKSTAGQIFSKETAKEIPGQVGALAKNILVETPVKIAKSLADIPYQAVTGKDIPGTYQSEAAQTAGEIVEGKKPLISALTPFITVPLDVTSTVGLGMGAKQAAQGIVKGATPLITEKLAKTQTERAAKAALEADRLTGAIVQGTPEDISAAKKALTSIDTTDIKTYKDLTDTLNTKISTLSNKLDNILESSPIYEKPLLVSQMDTSINVGGKSVAHNYVDDALSQLKTFYSKTNNVAKEAAIDQMILRGETEGLTIKELNEIAKLHGQDLSGFNASGELASGLTKQAAENTRMGVKTTAREIFGDDAYKALDIEQSNLIKTKQLADDMVTKVNTLQQKIQERSLGEKVGRLVFKVADLLTGGGLKGFVSATLPRGAGYKTLNALDLESMLNKNLQQLDKAINAKSESEIIKTLEGILNQSSTPARSTLNVQPTTKMNSNTSISNTIPQSKLSVKGVINNIKNIPNKQGGFINLEEVAKSISTSDKNIMQAFIDAVNTGKTPSKSVMLAAQDLANAMDLKSATATNKTLAKDFTSILDIERQNLKKKM